MILSIGHLYKYNMLLRIKFAIFYLLYFEKYLLYKLLYGEHAVEHLVEKVMYPRLALKLLGIPVGTNCRIRNGLVLYNYNKGNLTIGNNVHIGKGVLLDLSESITIEDNCTISMGVRILTHMNVGDSALKEDYPKRSGPIWIEESVYLGAQSLVLHTAQTIACKTLLASNSTLDSMTTPNAIYAGSPASLKKSI